MSRRTIDYGIDLGTTNSEIAVFMGTDTRVFKNSDQFEHTPSAVWIDGRGRLEVGNRARGQHEVDPDNATIEFKRQMHRADPIVFKASGRKMLPEELSAEVLKQLKADVALDCGETIRAAVISVPASFQAEAIAATKRAATLAGLDTCALLTEPACAAIAYGLREQAGNELTRWLVYDLGGGTFDAAIVKNESGHISIEDSEGDNFLGGKNIDYDIVNDLLVPELLKQANLRDFRRDNPKWKAAFATLRYHAEVAKIRLSRSNKEFVDIRALCSDETGSAVDFYFELTREQIRRIAEPHIAKSINICKALLRKKNLRPREIEKIILVGGPTLMPCLREQLAALDVPLEHRVDPFTVVARGAAIYASSQVIACSPPRPRHNEYGLALDAKSAGAEEEPVVSGQVVSASEENLSGFMIEFANPDSQPPWKGPRVPLNAEGHFVTTVRAQSGPNAFRIKLVDRQGDVRTVRPSDFSYSVIPVDLSGQVLFHAVSVGHADNTVETLFQRGAPLPVKLQNHVLKTAITLRKGTDDKLLVPILEGDRPRADRNQRYGTVEISARDFPRDLPAGSDVYLHVEIDESRLCNASVEIAEFDLEFSIQLVKPPPKSVAQTLERQLGEEKKRLHEVKEKARDAKAPLATERLEELESEQLLRSAQVAMSAAATDADAADVGANRLLDLQCKLDDVEAALELPLLEEEAKALIETAPQFVGELGKGDDRSKLDTHLGRVRDALRSGDIDYLRNEMALLRVFVIRLCRESPKFVVISFGMLEKDAHNMTNQTEARRLIAQGHKAMHDNNLRALETVVEELRDLLPDSESPEDKFLRLSTVVKGR